MKVQKCISNQLIILIVILVSSILLASCGPQSTASAPKKPTPTPTHTPTPTPSPTPDPTPTPVPTPTYPPVVSPSAILGIVADPVVPFSGIPWVRLGYATCIGNNMRGEVLKSTIEKFHSQGVRVMLSICQWTTDAHLFDTNILNDAAQGGADAVQCGNEQMKWGLNRYVPPAIFARFFDLCGQAMHAVRPEIPIILGALDPHVGGIDYGPLVDQVNYLNAMQMAMNTSVHPGGNWNWHSQTLGLIDSWHNGYPSQATNSLYYLYLFWAQQFGVNLDSGALGKHLWVIEGTGCIFGCGINSSSRYVVAVSHILTLITDVQTTLRYHVPFFYFSARDFYTSGEYWPMGVRNSSDLAKPLRQDLPMGARTLTMSCSSGQVVVSTQEQLLAKLYNGCALPGDYIRILTS